MKIAIVTYGTEGDTRPLAALGRAMMDAGHDIRLLADAATLRSASALGVPSAALSGDIRRALAPGHEVYRKGGFNSTAKALTQIVNDHTSAWMREVHDASVGCDAIVVSALASFVGLSVGESRRIPVIGAGFIPITPTAAFPSPFLPPGIVPGWLNRASHRFVNAMLWRAFRAATNAARIEVCKLPPRKQLWEGHSMLYGVSPSLLPRPADWPDNAHTCGQWRMSDPEWTPPPALEQFLDAGEPPVYIGFGSMAGSDPRHLATEIVAAVGGRRALFYPGWSGIDATVLPKNFFVVGDTPHHWLFPRTSVVVHHGGAGTTHSAARAGVPSVVVPFAGDQFFWAHRLEQSGVAGEAVSGNRMQRAALARSIALAEQDEVRARARALGARMATEDGLTAAVSTLEALLASR